MIGQNLSHYRIEEVGSTFRMDCRATVRMKYSLRLGLARDEAADRPVDQSAGSRTPSRRAALLVGL